MSEAFDAYERGRSLPPEDVFNQSAELRTSLPTASIMEALANAQGKFTMLERKHTGQVQGETRSGAEFSYTFSYADLADGLAMALPILSEQGISLVQVPVRDGANWKVVTRLSHKTGEWIEGDFPVFWDTRGTMQKFGAALTYAKRYGFFGLVGIAAERETDVDQAEGDDSPTRGRGAPPAERQAPTERVARGGAESPLPTEPQDQAARRQSTDKREELLAALKDIVDRKALTAFANSNADAAAKLAPDDYVAVKKAIDSKGRSFRAKPNG